MNIRFDFELGKFFTFQQSKQKPIYNWIYYKEGFDPIIVEKFIDLFNIKNGNFLDPFCGVGTGLLVAKGRGLFGYGLDISPLAVLASKVKTRNYTQSDLSEIKKIKDVIFENFFSMSQSINWQSPSINWRFELFDIKKAFPPSNLKQILYLREKIENIEDEKIKDFFLLALLSILPMCSFVLKDGGVLKIKNKKVAPVKELFKRKIKKMIFDLEKFPIKGEEPEVLLADARSIPFNQQFDLIVTSPPYLNNIDYTKVYGLELSLLELKETATKKTREQSIRSFITLNTKISFVPPEVGEIGFKIPVIGAYFSDMEQVLKEVFDLLRPSSNAVFIVGNCVIYDTHILVDEILAEIGQRIGFETEIVVGMQRIADVKPAKVKVRESAIVFKKP